MQSDLLDRLKETLGKRAEIKFAYLFGSQAKGKADRLSDIDVAVYVDEEVLHADYPYGYQATLTTDLMKALQTNAVDVVVLNQAKPFLRFQIMRYGKLILSRANAQRIALQVRTLNEYQDVKRLLEVQHRALSRRIKEGRFGQPV